MSGPFGAGPYRSYDGAQAAETLVEFNQLLAQLREAAREQHWLIDWPRLESFLSAAATARAAGDLPAATRQTALGHQFSDGSNPPATQEAGAADSSRIDL